MCATIPFTIFYAPYKRALQRLHNLGLRRAENTMKNTLLRFAAAAAITGGMLLAAQELGGPPPPAVERPHRAARLIRYLNLTPAQAAQASAEFQAARQAAQPIRQRLKQLHAAMSQAVRANDTAGIQRLSAREARLKGRVAAIRQEAFARIYSTLTPEQRAKADQLPAHRRIG
jgi:Spy/CpxP family protein refolding chaperone